MGKIYLDTSVFGGFFEPEFEIWTKILFEKINLGEYKVMYSRLTDIELARAPEHVKSLAMSLPNTQVDFIDITEEAVNLAEQYIKENVVGKTSRADCIHIALATVYHADMLVSWNFKHIVNIHRIRGYNAVNYRLGYKLLEIRTPREILSYEDRIHKKDCKANIDRASSPNSRQNQRRNLQFVDCRFDSIHKAKRNIASGFGVGKR